ncbi:MAG: hypothetical protein V3W20_08795 [Candidatus Neomarinimicrobiota bacterium]|jgi:hypothetical protein
MRNKKFYSGVFIIAALYDFILGITFFLFYKPIYAMFNMPLPQEPAYLHAAAGFVFAQGLLYYYVYKDLKRNVDIVKVGLLYKFVYIGVAIYYIAINQIPHPTYPVFALLDIVFVWLFILYLKDYKSIFPNSE